MSGLFMVVLEENMKRVFIMLAVVLMTALAAFAVNTSAHATDSSLPDYMIGSRHEMIEAKVTDSEVISLRTSHQLLDAQPANEFDADEIEEDGINTRVATVWIICISAVCIAAIIAFAVVMAKRNQGQK